MTEDEDFGARVARDIANAADTLLHKGLQAAIDEHGSEYAVYGLICASAMSAARIGMPVDLLLEACDKYHNMMMQSLASDMN